MQLIGNKGSLPDLGPGRGVPHLVHYVNDRGGVPLPPPTMQFFMPTSPKPSPRMPEPPTEEEVQRLVETQPGMLNRATGLLKALLRGEISPRDAEFQATELKIQADENLATARKLAATKGEKS